jgi:glycosyltransferase involved in cell wall biosynthesis
MEAPQAGPAVSTAAQAGIVGVRRLLTIGHSYVVGQNRRLAHEMAVAGAGEWDVTAVAPAWLAGDLREIALEPLGGERCRVLPLTMALGRVPHLRQYRGLAPILRQRWDLVHCWEEPYVAAAWQVARHMPPGATLVVATFQNISKRYPPPFSWMERSVMRRANAWIPFGVTGREALGGRRGYAARPAQVIGPGVDVERFSPDADARARVRASCGWDEGIPVIGYLGRFVPEKGIELLLAAMRRARRPWRALLVGSGPLAGSIESFAASYPGRVRVVQGVVHDEVPDYLNAMDVLCAPSQTRPHWREQFGRMLIEAMACGVAVAGSDSGEIPHVLGEAGLVLPEASVEAWAAALDRLLADPGSRRGLGQAGLARVRREFAWPIVAQRHLQFFDILLGA